MKKFIDKILSRFGYITKYEHDLELECLNTKHEFEVEDLNTKHDLEVGHLNTKIKRLEENIPKFYFNDTQIHGIVDNEIILYEWCKGVKFTLALDEVTYENLLKHLRETTKAGRIIIQNDFD